MQDCNMRLPRDFGRGFNWKGLIVAFSCKLQYELMVIENSKHYYVVWLYKRGWFNVCLAFLSHAVIRRWNLPFSPEVVFP